LGTTGTGLSTGWLLFLSAKQLHEAFNQYTQVNQHSCITVFLPRDASAERGDATVSRLSVCLSVHPSVRNV